MKDFVTYEQALELKELGFDESCFGYFTKYEEFFYFDVDDLSTSYTKNMDNLVVSSVDELKCSAPIYQQAFRFFREKYDLVHEISWSKYKGGLNFDYDVFSLVLPTDDELGDEDDIASDKSMETYDSLVDKGFKYKESDTYEEAEVACLNKLIEIVKNKNI